jgi:LCP family protein required for cell wall assembly
VKEFAQRFAVALVVTFVLSVASIGGAYWKANDWWDDTATVDVQVDEQEAGQAANFLIIGSDTRSFIDDVADEEHFGSAADQGGQRSDTIMVAHVDPDAETGMLVSFPRDLWVQVPGLGPSKINAAYNAGPQRVIDTIKQNFDIPIHHYLEVNFEGFRNIVDAVGSVSMHFAAPARDTVTGLSIAEAGCHALDGDQALALVRSRAFEYQDADGEWRGDDKFDLGRIERQQSFVRALADEMVHDVVRNPTRLGSILDKALAEENLQRDEKLGLSDVTALVDTFRDVDPAALETITVPTRREFIDGQDALVLVEEEAAPIFERLRSFGGEDDVPAGVAPQDVSVAVWNGSGVGGRARAVLDALVAQGFEGVEPPANAERNDFAVTEVRHGPDGAAKARLVLGYLGGAGRTVELAEPPDVAEVLVVVGRDFAEVAPPATSATSAPADARAGDGDAATTPSTTATPVDDPTVPRAC